MSNLQLKVDYFLDERIKDIVNGTMYVGDCVHVLLFLASKVIKRKEYDGITITVNELQLSFKELGNVWLNDVISVLENELWELV